MSRPHVQCISTLPTAHEPTVDDARADATQPAGERSGQAGETSTGSAGKPGSSSAV